MGTPRYRGWRWIIVVAVMLVGPAAVAQEGVFTVTRTDDPEPDGCRPDDCSLREAVLAANARPEADVVALPAGVFELTRVDPTVTQQSTQPPLRGQRLYLEGEVVLRGAGREQTVIDLDRMPPVDEAGWAVGPGLRAAGGSLTLEELTMRGARGAFWGALYANQTSVTLRAVGVIGNRSPWAIDVDNQFSSESLLVEDSLFEGNANGALRYQNTASVAGTRAATVRRSVFRDNGGLSLYLHVSTKAAPQGPPHNGVVEDSRFEGSAQAIDGVGHLRVSRSSFIGNGGTSGGGAMHFDQSAPVLLERVLVDGNTATNVGGGVVGLNLVVRDSVFRANEAGSDGGAIWVRNRHGRSSLDISGSALVGNSAGGGGAIYAGTATHARLTNVTLSGNIAREIRLPGGEETRPGGRGGALYVAESATASLVHATVVRNRGDFAFFAPGRMDFVSSVVADTTNLTGSPANHCARFEGSLTYSGGFNLTDDHSCGLDAAGDQFGEPELGPLRASGVTSAHVPLEGSPLVDGAGRSACLEVDQRSLVRPIDGDGDGNALCDIGAVEVKIRESGRIGRLAGADRVATAVEVSRSSYGNAGADVVVLARADAFADGLAGGPLAAAGAGPLLLTGREGLDAQTEVELVRVLPKGGQVLLLGGPEALRVAVETRVAQLGFSPVRIGGGDRYETAVAIARRLGDPRVALLASGTDFPDALSAGAAAVGEGGAVLLTADDQLPPSTGAYLAARPGLKRVAVGGPAAAADPSAEPLVGPDRYATSVAVARRFQPAPASVGIASGVTFPDALAAGPNTGHRGPLLLSLESGPPRVVLEYLTEVAPAIADTDTVERALIYGGEAALSSSIESHLHYYLGPGSAATQVG